MLTNQKVFWDTNTTVVQQDCLKDNTIVKIIAVTEIGIAVTLLVYNAVQIAYFLWLNGFQLQALNVRGVLPLTVVWWLSTISVNVLQIYVASQLLKVTTRRREFSAGFFIENTKLWLRASPFFYLILTLKLCLAIFVRWALDDQVLVYLWFGSVTLIIFEILFRIVGVHYVRRFLDRLPILRRIHVHSFYWNSNGNIHTLT